MTVGTRKFLYKEKSVLTIHSVFYVFSIFSWIAVKDVNSNEITRLYSVHCTYNTVTENVDSAFIILTGLSGNVTLN